MIAKAAGLLALALLPAAAQAAWLDALPRRSPRNESFYSAFSRGVLERENGWAGASGLSCAPEGACGFQTTAGWLAGSQARMVSRAAEQALRAQYALDEWTRGWLSRPWDARKAGVAAVIGAAELYTDGVRLHETAAGWDLRGTLAAARRLRGDGRLATLELGRTGGPLSFSAAWGRTLPAFGARYSLRY